MPTISAVICTYKRADYLRVALRSLCQQTLARDQYEVLVVDNAGEAEVSAIVDEFKAENVDVRYVLETQVGLSHARNCALKEARGEYIAYLDDDARANADWLEMLVRAFRNTEAAAIGGRVWLDWDGEKPVWVNDEQLSLFTFVDHGDEGHALRQNEYLVGANLAFKKDLLKEIGGFDANLGRQGAVLLSGEEAKALSEMSERGWAVYYEPAAVVWHSVHPSRKKPSWLLRRMFWDGASQPLLDHRAPERSRRVMLRGLRKDLRQCAGWFARAISARLRGRKTIAWQAALGLSQRAGRVRTQVRLIASVDD